MPVQRLDHVRQQPDEEEFGEVVWREELVARRIGAHSSLKDFGAGCASNTKRVSAAILEYPLQR